MNELITKLSDYGQSTLLEIKTSAERYLLLTLPYPNNIATLTAEQKELLLPKPGPA